MHFMLQVILSSSVGSYVNLPQGPDPPFIQRVQAVCATRHVDDLVAMTFHRIR